MQSTKAKALKISKSVQTNVLKFTEAYLSVVNTEWMIYPKILVKRFMREDKVCDIMYKYCNSLQKASRTRKCNFKRIIRIISEFVLYTYMMVKLLRLSYLYRKKSI